VHINSVVSHVRTDGVDPAGDEQTRLVVADGDNRGYRRTWRGSGYTAAPVRGAALLVVFYWNLDVLGVRLFQLLCFRLELLRWVVRLARGRHGRRVVRRELALRSSVIFQLLQLFSVCFWSRGRTMAADSREKHRSRQWIANTAHCGIRREKVIPTVQQHPRHRVGGAVYMFVACFTPVG
jgi:hypothetical protein